MAGEKIARLKHNLAKIASNQSIYLKEAAAAVLKDVKVERIDGQKQIDGSGMKRNKRATMARKRAKGRKPYDHPLWDSQTMRKIKEWVIRAIGKAEVILQPGKGIAYRVVQVQKLGYLFFGVSRDGRDDADKAVEKKLRKDLEKGL